MTPLAITALAALVVVAAPPGHGASPADVDALVARINAVHRGRWVVTPLARPEPAEPSYPGPLSACAEYLDGPRSYRVGTVACLERLASAGLWLHVRAAVVELLAAPAGWPTSDLLALHGLYRRLVDARGSEPESSSELLDACRDPTTGAQRAYCEAALRSALQWGPAATASEAAGTLESLGPRTPSAFLQLARYHYTSGRRLAAAVAYVSALERLVLRPPSASWLDEVQLELAIVLVELGRPAVARRILRRLSPGALARHVQLPAAVLAGLGRTEDLTRLMRLVAARSPAVVLRLGMGLPLFGFVLEQCDLAASAQLHNAMAERVERLARLAQVASRAATDAALSGKDALRALRAVDRCLRLVGLGSADSATVSALIAAGSGCDRWSQAAAERKVGAALEASGELRIPASAAAAVERLEQGAATECVESASMLSEHVRAECRARCDELSAMRVDYLDALLGEHQAAEQLAAATRELLFPLEGDPGWALLVGRRCPDLAKVSDIGQVRLGDGCHRLCDGVAAGPLGRIDPVRIDPVSRAAVGLDELVLRGLRCVAELPAASARRLVSELPAFDYLTTPHLGRSGGRVAPSIQSALAARARRNELEGRQHGCCAKDRVP